MIPCVFLAKVRYDLCGSFILKTHFSRSNLEGLCKGEIMHTTRNEEMKDS